MKNRPRKRVTTTEIVSSTAFSLSKNPAMFDKVSIYEPDPKVQVTKRKEVADKKQTAKFDDVWAQIKAAASKL